MSEQLRRWILWPFRLVWWIFGGFVILYAIVICEGRPWDGDAWLGWWADKDRWLSKGASQ